MASGSDHIAHVSSQIPYALTAGGATFVAYLVDGLANSLVLGIVAGFAVAVVAILIQNKITVNKYKDYDFDAELKDADKSTAQAGV